MAVSGVVRFFHTLVMGIVSMFVKAWRWTARMVSAYPDIALGGFIVCLILVWVATFVGMRTRAVGAESQRDKIAYEYMIFKEEHGYE